MYNLKVAPGVRALEQWKYPVQLLRAEEAPSTSGDSEGGTAPPGYFLHGLGSFSSGEEYSADYTEHFTDYSDEGSGDDAENGGESHFDRTLSDNNGKRKERGRSDEGSSDDTESARESRSDKDDE